MNNNEYQFSNFKKCTANRLIRLLKCQKSVKKKVLTEKRTLNQGLFGNTKYMSAMKHGLMMNGQSFKRNNIVEYEQPENMRK